MSTTDNERSASTRLRTALVYGERLDRIAAAVQACPLLELVGQSGNPHDAALRDVPWLADWRVLVARPDVQVVILAGGLRADIEVARLAAQHGIHTWRLPPLAGSFAEGLELATHLHKPGPIHRVASWWEHLADHAWGDLQWPDGFAPLYSELRAAGPGPSVRSWRASATEAPGGALADAGYDLLETLVATRGLPESVTAATGHYRNAPGAAPRETEDATLALLRYAGNGTALVRATWDMPPFEQTLALYAQGAGVLVSRQEVMLVAADGAVRDRRPLPDDYLAGELQRFVELVRGNARDRAALALERHLAVSALLDAVYLAARTGHPESPRKHYEVQGRPVPKT
jgi:predicted dehydrogenase